MQGSRHHAGQVQEPRGRSSARLLDNTHTLSRAIRIDLSSCSITQAQGVPDKIKKLFFGIKSKAEQETERQRRIASEAQWRAECNSKQVFNSQSSFPKCHIISLRLCNSGLFRHLRKCLP